MLKLIFESIKGVVAITILVIATLLMVIFTFISSLISLLPISSLKNAISRTLHNMPEYWTSVSNFTMRLTNSTKWNVHGIENLDPHGHYFMMANHRSWLDILVLQKVFSKKIPGLRFFMKKELMWQLPLMGYACKLLGYPFMQRYSREFLEKNPHLKGKDIEATRKACEEFKDNPVTFINFIEGGRFTEEKHKKQNSPYKYLLKPKAGGIAFVLAAMSDQIENIIDVTIIYPSMDVSFWDFLCGRVEEISIYIHTLPIKDELIGNYQSDEHFRNFFQYWLNEQWAEKDKFMINKLNNH